MTKPKVERGWMAWSKYHGLYGELFATKELCKRVYHDKAVEVEIRQIPKKKGVRRGK